MSGEPVVARIGGGVAYFAAGDWDRLRRRRTIPSSATPSCRRSRIRAARPRRPAGGRCRSRSTAPDGRPAALMPAYLKSHSLGEYVFDHGWADAYERAGGAYYPKLQIAVPFTPVPGRRLLARDPALAPALIAAARARGRGQRPLLGARDLHPARRGGPVRARRLADPRRQPVPLAEPGLCELRGFPRHLVVAQAQGDPARSGPRRWRGWRSST